MWGEDVLKAYGDKVEFVGLCDVNPGRLETAKRMMGVSCPTFVNFEEMVTRSKPDTVIVTTVDGTHHTFIAQALAMGCEVITEKPMTTDEVKLRTIFDARKRSEHRIIVAHNEPSLKREKNLCKHEHWV